MSSFSISIVFYYSYPEIVIITTTNRSYLNKRKFLIFLLHISYLVLFLVFYLSDVLLLRLCYYLVIVIVFFIFFLLFYFLCLVVAAIYTESEVYRKHILLRFSSLTIVSEVRLALEFARSSQQKHLLKWCSELIG